MRFLRDVVGDPERASDFDGTTPEEYAGHKRAALVCNGAETGASDDIKPGGTAVI